MSKKLPLIYKFIFILVFLYGSTGKIFAAEIIFEDNFDNQPLNQNLTHSKQWKRCSGNCPTVTKERSKAGGRSLKTTLNRTKDKTAFRTEVVPRGEGVGKNIKLNVDYWYGFSIFIPTSHKNDYLGGDTLAQWHDYNGTSGRNPTLNLGLKNDSWRLLLRHENFTKSWSLGKFKKGAWTDIVVHARWASNSSGELEIWIDSKKLVNYTGKTSWKDPYGPYLKLGLYKSAWKKKENAGIRYDASITKRTFYHDELRIAKGSDASYKDVAHGGSRSSNDTDSLSPPISLKITQ